MSMSTHIKAFIPDTDADFKKHKKVLLACNEADVSLPKETAEYFGSENSGTYLLDEKLEIQLSEGIHYKNWSDNDEGSSGFEVDLTNIPKGVTKLRFYNNW